MRSKIRPFLLYLQNYLEYYSNIIFFIEWMGVLLYNNFNNENGDLY